MLSTVSVCLNLLLAVYYLHYLEKKLLQEGIYPYGVWLNGYLCIGYIRCWDYHII